MGHLTFVKLPRINNCKTCDGTGVIHWYNLDGGPYYSWMKPKSKNCTECKGVAYENRSS
jgi:DnaJ-class molecular chaperone